MATAIPLPKGLRGKIDSPKQIEALINCFYQGGEVPTTTPRPGVLNAKTGIGKCRGSGLFNEELYQVSGTQLIRITVTGIVTGEFPEPSDITIEDLGTIEGGGECELEASFTQLAIMAVNGKAYIYDKVSNLREVTDSNYVASISLAQDQGRFVFVPANGDPFFWTELLDPTNILPTNFADAELFPDPNKAVIYRKKSIYVLGTRSIEQLIFNPVKDTYEAISAVSSNVGYVGCLNYYGESFTFLGRGQNGGYSFYVMGQQAIPISNPTVDEIVNNIKKYTLDDLEGSISDYFRWEGFDIGVYHLSRDTFAFTGDWSQWYSGKDKNDDPTWRIRSIQFAYGFLWTGDFNSNTIGILTSDASEYGQNVEGEIITFIKALPRTGFDVNRVYAQCNTGQSNSETGIALSISEDGINYGEEDFTPLGDKGHYNQEISWGSPVIRADNHVSLKLRWVGDVIVNTEGVSFD